jgi:hypothetical protein
MDSGGKWIYLALHPLIYSSIQFATTLSLFIIVSLLLPIWSQVLDSSMLAYSLCTTFHTFTKGYNASYTFQLLSVCLRLKYGLPSNGYPLIFLPFRQCPRTLGILWNLRFSQQWLWRVLSAGIWCRVVRWKSTDVSEEHIADLCLPPAFTLVSCSAYSSTLKMEVICSSKTLADFQWTTGYYSPEDSILSHYELLLWPNTLNQNIGNKR